MSQFASREAVIEWINAHVGQAIRLGRTGSTLRLEGVTQGIQELDACSTEIPYGELRTGLSGVHVAVSLHDEELSLHVLMGEANAGRAALSLPLSIPYAQLRLAGPDEQEDGPSPEEPEFSPYELLHFPRSR